jgi:2,3-bisphosphoglycerate-dependent phosphoglycerate mutase
MLLYLIRHAQSQNNARPAYCRVEDPPLTAVGRLQTHYLAQWMRRFEFDMLVTSPVLRAVQTTRAIHDRTGHHVHVWANLFEEGGIFRGFGPQASEGGPGLKRSQVGGLAASNPKLCTLDPSITEAGWWGRTRESPDEASRRASDVAKRLTLCVRNQGRGVVVVTHADFKRRLLDCLLGKSLESLQVNRLSNTGVTKLKLDSSVWRLSYLDEVAHLPPRLVTGIKV